MKTYEVELTQADVEVLDDALSHYMDLHSEGADPLLEMLSELRVTLNSALTCEAGECDEPRKANDVLCAHCAATRDEAKAGWEAYGRRETEQSRTYEQDMREAGRGHLLR